MKNKYQFLLIPLAGTVAGGGTAVATTFNASDYTGNESTISLSTITYSPWFTFDGKFVLPFRNLIFFPNDVLLSKEDSLFMIYRQYTLGNGGNTIFDNKLLLHYNYLRFYHSLIMKVGKKVFIGAGYDFDDHFNVNVDDDTAAQANIYVYEKESWHNTISPGPLINFLIDSRRNIVNPPGGDFFAIDYRLKAQFLVSTFDWQSILIEARKYLPFHKRRKNFLAFWSYYWGITNGKAPYLDLPSIRRDDNIRSGHGFQQNRYRGKRLLNIESEYRNDITKNGFRGFVVFANIQSVSEFPDNYFEYWHPAVGAGLALNSIKYQEQISGLILQQVKILPASTFSWEKPFNYIVFKKSVK